MALQASIQNAYGAPDDKIDPGTDGGIVHAHCDISFDPRVPGFICVGQILLRKKVGQSDFAGPNI